MIKNSIRQSCCDFLSHKSTVYIHSVIKQRISQLDSKYVEMIVEALMPSGDNLLTFCSPSPIGHEFE